MLLDKRIRKELRRLTVPHEVKKTKDHYILMLEDGSSLVIGGNHPRARDNLVGYTINKIRRLQDGHSDD